MTIILIFFLVTLIFLLKNKSVAMILVIMQLISIVGTFFLGRYLEIETPEDYGWIFLMIFLLFLIIIGWKDYYKIKEIASIDEKKLKIITWFLIILNSMVFVVFLLVSILVQSTVENINEFKYAEGVSTDFYYKMLPFPVVFFNIAVIFYYFSYFILPLHFYYLYKKNIWLSLICLLLSFNIVLYGLTFFSRAVVVQFALLYIVMMYLTYESLPKKITRVFNVIMIFVGLMSVIYFVNISQKRFDEDKKSAKTYSNTIPVEAFTQDPVVYGYFDYTSQGFLNGYEVLQLYEGEGFNGKLTMGNLLSFVSTPLESYELLRYRQKLWPYHYSYSFNGFVAYAVYDYGVFGSIIFCFLYFFIVRKMRPKNGALQLRDLFLITLLIQIPLMSIFYNQMGGIFIAFLLWIPLWFYIKINISK